MNVDFILVLVKQHAHEECMKLENQNLEFFHVLCQSVIITITNNKLAESYQEEINQINLIVWSIPMFL